MDSPIKWLNFLYRERIIDPDRYAHLQSSHGPLEKMESGPLLQLFLEQGLLSTYQIQLVEQGFARQLLAGPFIIERLVGRGGMGRVFEAKHQLLQRKVALKVVHKSSTSSRGYLERLYREACNTAQLDHPNIVRIYDILERKDFVAIVMEFIDGMNLRECISRTPALSLPQVCWYVAQAAAGLQHAHDRGFIHRDVKPENLLLNRDGFLKIVDFGLTRSVIQIEESITQEITPNTVVGTIDFMSPEQLKGEAPNSAQDWYSLGATFFTLITGKLPFRGTTAEKIIQHEAAELPFLFELDAFVPAQIAGTIRRLLAKDPEDRHQSGQELVRELEPWLPENSKELLFQQFPRYSIFEDSPTVPIDTLSPSDVPSVPNGRAVLQSEDILHSETDFEKLSLSFSRFVYFLAVLLCLGSIALFTISASQYGIDGKTISKNELIETKLLYQIHFKDHLGKSGVVTKDKVVPDHGEGFPLSNELQFITWDKGAYKYEVINYLNDVCLSFLSESQDAAIEFRISNLPVEVLPKSYFRFEIDYSLHGHEDINTRFQVSTPDDEQQWTYRVNRSIDDWQTAVLDIEAIRGNTLDLSIVDQSKPIGFPRLYIREIRIYSLNENDRPARKLLTSTIEEEAGATGKVTYKQGRIVEESGRLLPGWHVEINDADECELELLNRRTHPEMDCRISIPKGELRYVCPEYYRIPHSGFYSITFETNYTANNNIDVAGYLILIEAERVHGIYDYSFDTIGGWRETTVKFYAEPGTLKLGFSMNQGQLRFRNLRLYKN